MKHAAALLLAMALLLSLAPLAQAATTFMPYIMDEEGIITGFPQGWTVVTPETTGKHMKWFSEPTAEIAANNLLSEGVAAIAFSPDGSETLRILIAEDDDSSVYYDIDRYTTEMRSAIRADFLDTAAWKLTGYRFSEAEWTNREGQRRILWLNYTLRYGEEIVARGQQAFTVRGGKRITMEYRIEGKMTDAARAMFKAFVAETKFPEPDEAVMPLLPVGLETTSPLPEESNKTSVVIRGTTSPKAVVSATLTDEDGKAVNAGSAAAESSGAFRLTLTLPGEGEWQLKLTAHKEGLADSALTGWLVCDFDRLPVNFTSYLSGDVYDSTLKLSGKTLGNVKIQCIEGTTNKTAYSDSSGNFSFTLDKGITGERTVVLAMGKKGYTERRFTITFNRCWESGEYAKYLAGKVESLSYENLAEKGEKFIGRIIKYSGTVRKVSSSGDRFYVQFARDDDDAKQLIAVYEGEGMTLFEGDAATVYLQVTGESYSVSTISETGDESMTEIPSVKLLHYEKEL